MKNTAWNEMELFGMKWKSADPGLRQGRGGAWDHRRCGTCFSCSPLLVCQSWQRLTPQLLFQTEFKPRQTILARRRHSGRGLSCSLNKALRPWLPCSSQAPLRQRQTFPAAPTRPWGRGSVLLWRFKAAVCQAWKLPNPSLQLAGATSAAADLSCRIRALLLLAAPRPLRPRQTFPAAPTRPWGRGSVLYGGSRLPFARPGNSPNPPVQLAGATQATADLSCSSNKALRPWQCPFMEEVQGCRLPGLETPQTLPCSSQAPLRPRQTFPAASTRPWGRGFPAAWGRGSVLLWRFKAPVCQAWKLPKPFPCSSQAPLRPRQTFPAAPTRPWGRGFPAAPRPLRPRQTFPAANKALRPWQCPFMEVQGCRLPGLETPQTLPCSSQAPLRPRQTFPAASTRPWGRGFPAAWGRGSVLLWRFKAPVCQAWKLPKPFPSDRLQTQTLVELAEELLTGGWSGLVGGVCLFVYMWGSYYFLNLYQI